jgi:hypothetical protein
MTGVRHYVPQREPGFTDRTETSFPEFFGTDSVSAVLKYPSGHERLMQSASTFFRHASVVFLFVVPRNDTGFIMSSDCSPHGMDTFSQSLLSLSDYGPMFSRFAIAGTPILSWVRPLWSYFPTLTIFGMASPRQGLFHSNRGIGNSWCFPISPIGYC